VAWARLLHSRKTNIFRFARVLIALGLLLLSGLLFVDIGGTAGWISFVTAFFVICYVEEHFIYRSCRRKGAPSAKGSIHLQPLPSLPE
jgi:hypothetical protein